MSAQPNVFPIGSDSPVRMATNRTSDQGYGRQFMTNSVVDHLLASTESEDMTSFAQRAYHLIRNRAVDDAIGQLRDSTLTME